MGSPAGARDRGGTKASGIAPEARGTVIATGEEPGIAGMAGPGNTVPGATGVLASEDGRRTTAHNTATT